MLVDDLKYKSEFGSNYGKYQNGYRVVYFYQDNTYKVGTFSGTIEGFMMDFAEIEPIEDENAVPDFISLDDLLNRYLFDVKDAIAVAIYKTDGTCIQKKERNTIQGDVKK